MWFMNIGWIVEGIRKVRENSTVRSSMDKVYTILGSGNSAKRKRDEDEEPALKRLKSDEGF